MIIQMSGLIIGANRYRVRNMSGGSVYLLQKTDEDQTNMIGLEMKRLDMEYILLDTLVNFKLPSFFDLQVDASRGGQDEAKLHLESVTQVYTDRQKNIDEFVKYFEESISTQNPLNKFSKDKFIAPSLCLSATSYNMQDEGISGGRVYVCQMTKPDNKDQIGMEVMKLRITLQLYELLKVYGLPGYYDLKIIMERGSRDKARFRVQDVLSENNLTQELLLSTFGLKQLTTSQATSKTTVNTTGGLDLKETKKD